MDRINVKSFHMDDGATIEKQGAEAFADKSEIGDKIDGRTIVDITWSPCDFIIRSRHKPQMAESNG